MPGKRKSTLTYNQRFKRARMQMRTRAGYRRMLSRNLPARFGGKGSNVAIITRVNNLYRMIETKENCLKTSANVALSHNQANLVNDSNGSALNIFYTTQNAGDPMQANQGNRVGDQVTVKGVMIKGFFENALARPKVFYRVMLLKGSKGETFSRANIFKGDADNKMIDQVNTERFTIIAQKIFNISASNIAASAAEVPNGAPLTSNAGGIGSRTFKMWIPGTKFGRNGNVIYENGSTAQVKFYDYRLVIVVYDWYGTPQDVNTVGRINELYTKVYFKDA